MKNSLRHARVYRFGVYRTWKLLLTIGLELPIMFNNYDDLIKRSQGKLIAIPISPIHRTGCRCYRKQAGSQPSPWPSRR